MTEITYPAFKELVAQKEFFVLMVGAEGCGPCKALKPIVDDIAEEYPEVAFYYLDINRNYEFDSEYTVMGVPTLFFFKNNKLVNRSVGAAGKLKLVNMMLDLTEEV